MSVKYFCSLLVILSLLGCLIKNPISTVPIIPDEITNAEYRILSVTIDSLYFFPGNSILVLMDSTVTGTFSDNPDSASTITLEYVHQHIPELKPETMVNYKVKNLTRTFIQNPGKIHPACVRSSATDLIYPQISVSRVGFSADGRQALVYVGQVDAPLAGAGHYHVLSRTNRKWVITGTVMVWIS